MTDVVTQSELPVGTAPGVGYIGKRLGRFLITGELGRGGMATVYRARDPELGRDVAVKVMHGFLAGRADLEARFRREANAVATIHHPSILNVFDFASPAGEEPGYIVSELIEGPGLRTVIESRGGRLRPEVAALIVARVAEALGAAHAARIVHRDVKPDNVLIDRAGGNARIVLTDFGVAHVSSLDTMTATGAVLGSPQYMSPEQARGEDVGAASDVFSLGVTLYQLCTGSLPFAGKDPLGVVTAILRGQYRRPCEIEPRVSPELEKVIIRCLQSDPTARFADGAAVAVALRTALGDARATHLEDETAALRKFFEDPGAFEEALAAPVAQAAITAAEQARKSGQIPRALAEVGRALAYEPASAEAKALLDRLSTRRRFRAAGARVAAIAGILLIAGGAWVAWRQRTVHEPLPPSPTALAAAPAAAPAAPSIAVAALAAPASPPPAPVNQPAPAAGGKVTTEKADRGEAPARPRRRAVAAAAEKPRVSAAPGVAPARTAPTPVVVTPKPVPPSAENPGTAPLAPTVTATGSGAPEKPPEKIAEKAIEKPADKSAEKPAGIHSSIVLRASYGFCEPSLDAQPASLQASYKELAPGHHEIYCTLPQGGPKLHVATYDLRPGARASLVIVPGPDGRPIIGRSE